MDIKRFIDIESLEREIAKAIQVERQVTKDYWSMKMVADLLMRMEAKMERTCLCDPTLSDSEALEYYEALFGAIRRMGLSEAEVQELAASHENACRVAYRYYEVGGVGPVNFADPCAWARSRGCNERLWNWADLVAKFLLKQ